MSDPTPVRNPRARVSRNTRTTSEWPCVFGGSFVREQIDPRVKVEWAEARSDKPKFGDLRNSFRREHCRALNPWGSETCPFREDECAIAFLKAVQESLRARNAHGYFINVARSSGALRADMAVERRATDARMRTREAPEADPSRVGGAGPAGLRARPALGLGDEPRPAGGDMDAVPATPGESVRRTDSRPQRVGEMLGALDLRSRPRREGEAPR